MAFCVAKISLSPSAGPLKQHVLSSGIRCLHLLGISNRHETTRHHSFNHHCLLQNILTLHHSPSRQFSSIKNEDNDTKLSPSSLQHDTSDPSSSPTTSTSTTLLYESPFAPLTLKLKRVSLTSAAVGIVGLPLLTLFYGSGDVPATGQLAVIATAAVTAVGSTVLLGYCFTPYVHTLELVHNTGATTATTATATTNNNNDGEDNNNTTMIRMITRDILA